MSKAYHILNGDALKERFPKKMSGTQYICRECFVDGNIEGDTLEKLFSSRAKFISTSYSGFTIQDYHKMTVLEFERIQNIPENAEINLWFEEDVFCQVNLWFILYLIDSLNKNYSLCLVLPKPEAKYSFSKMTDLELELAFENKLKLNQSETEQIARLWVYFQSNDLTVIKKTASKLNARFPFLNKAVQALRDSIENDRPKNSLRTIINDLNTEKFEEVFSEFCIRESIYGYGDLQVKRLFDELILEMK